MMFQNNFRWLIIASLFFSGTVSRAHEGHEYGPADPSVRVWTFADTGAHIHGAYVGSRDGKVQVRRTDGTVISLEIEKLTILDQKWIERKVAQVKEINENTTPIHSEVKLVVANVPSKPEIAETFEPFAKLNAVKYRQDENFFYVESNSMPDHRMMVGITAWQQQVPIPQPYFGDNAWRIPLEPVVAKNPLSAKSHFFRGAIALAANGVPIFNPIKNDGRTDTLLAGELDEFGGHCGRGDDYHYHIAPTHLQEIVGKDRPIAYALDGYPIYGYTEPDGSEVQGLDEFNGHSTPQLGYHYHATRKYPYLNGGFHGEVKEVDGQVDPQPRAGGVREAPAGTKSFAISLWHTAPDQEKSYWLIYNIPATANHLVKNDKTTGTVGLNDKKRASYDPMCSKGPGAKTYHISVYALSSEVELAKGSDNRAALLKAIKGITLAEKTLDFVYERTK